ncbi:unnamed protein product [Moneuplotes crassus]|uniref:Uncharacterized protein n=1 Tax=Euplotes crassus TaxID=5936 RepID=A0AAD1UFT1_EUPCR|nr:unnamed protein product [Moneuplotes crassus]
MQSPSLDIHEIENRTIVEAINTKKEIFKGDINGFLNSLSEEEFAVYMQQAELNGEDLWNTGRENTLNVAFEGEDYTEIKEKESLEQSRQEEILREQFEIIESANKLDLMIFKAVSFNDFIQIFDIGCFEKLPLFVKLFYLKELLQYNSLYENRAFGYMSLFIAGANYAYYYFMKYIYFSSKMKLMSIPRFILLFFISDSVHSEIVLRYQNIGGHYVDLNALLDTDDLFLYDDPYYRALIKRVLTIYPQYVNDNFDFNEILEEKSEIFDKHFAARGNKQYFPPDVMDVFNISLGVEQDKKWRHSSINAFDRMMEKYGSFFNKQKEEFIKKAMDIYGTKVNSELVSSLVEYHDLMKENKLGKETRGVNPILNAPEHDYMKMLEEAVDVLDEHYDGIDINNQMPVEERIEVLRHYDEFDKKLAETEFPQADDLLDVTIGEEDIQNFKDKARFLPQRNMSYKEFLNIEEKFRAADFERSSFLSYSLPCAYALTYLVKRIFK